MSERDQIYRSHRMLGGKRVEVVCFDPLMQHVRLTSAIISSLKKRREDGLPLLDSDWPIIEYLYEFMGPRMISEMSGMTGYPVEDILGFLSFKKEDMQ